VTQSLFSPKHNRLRDALIAARKAQKLTQIDVSRKLRRPQSYVSKYERGERRLDVVEFLEVVRVIGADPCRILREVER
jgi:transcriptional regulator with XRE-family HTH domain